MVEILVFPIYLGFSILPSLNNKNLSLGFPKQSPLYQDRSHPFSKRMWQLSNSSLCLEKKSLKQVCDVEIYTVPQLYEIVTEKFREIKIKQCYL